MRSTPKEKIIFAIDNNNDLHTVAKFMRHIDTCRAMGTLKGNFTQCIGYWEGILEVSYMMNKDDYERLVVTLGYTKDQECVLAVPGDVRQPCSLVSPDLRSFVGNAGKMIEIDGPEGHNAWTFVPVTGKYFTCV